MFRTDFYIFLVFILQLEFFNATFVTTPQPTTAGSGSGAGPIDDEDQVKGRSGSGDYQASGSHLVPLISLNTTREINASVTPGGRVTTIALPTMQTELTSLTSFQAPTPPLPTTNYAACSSAGNSLLYSPECDPQQPSLYSARQCIHSRSVCFCVDRNSGRTLPDTEVSGNAGAGMSCAPLTFSVTIGFAGNWDPRLADPRSRKFKSLATQIEQDIVATYRDYSGSQTVKVLRFRSGSVLADLSITSVGHPAELETDVQKFKSLLDNRLHVGTLAGMRLNPVLYKFHHPLQPSLNGASGWQNQNRKNTPDGQMPLDASNLRQDMSGETTSAAEASIAGFPLSPGILGAIIGGGAGALLLIGLLIAFCVYRMRKADEGSYSLDPAAKKAASSTAYQKAPSREFYA